MIVKWGLAIVKVMYPSLGAQFFFEFVTWAIALSQDGKSWHVCRLATTPHSPRKTLQMDYSIFVSKPGHSLRILLYSAFQVASTNHLELTLKKKIRLTCVLILAVWSA